MIKAGDLVRFRGSYHTHTSRGRVYLVVEVEPPRQRHGFPSLHAHLRLTGPTIKGAPIETLLYPMYRFEVV